MLAGARARLYVALSLFETTGHKTFKGRPCEDPDKLAPVASWRRSFLEL